MSRTKGDHGVWGENGGFVGGSGLSGFYGEIWESCHRLVDATVWEKLRTVDCLATFDRVAGHCHLDCFAPNHPSARKP